MTKFVLIVAGIALVALSMPQISLAAQGHIVFTADATIVTNRDDIMVAYVSAQESTKEAARRAEKKQKAQEAQTQNFQTAVLTSSTLSSGAKVGHFTAYTCLQSWECSGDPTITASGQKTRWGIVAGPPSIPFGTKLKIDGFGDTIFVVADRGGAIQGNRFDIWMDSLDKAYGFGRRTLSYEIVP